MIEISPEQIAGFSNKLKSKLLDLRHPDGHWEGELSTSALSTATAVIALSVVSKKPFLLSPSKLTAEDVSSYINQGIQWLVQWQNSDGGWGDTIRSQSNISTTLLAWGALNSNTDEKSDISNCVEKAERWITQYAGGLQPDHIVQALLKKYGKDKTFSVPILSALALSGRLGQEEQAWQYIHQLPFELALFPQSWYAMLRLPVVSYALPALIAIGESRHAHNPTLNPMLRWIRNKSMLPAQKILQKIQPSSGGYLEAIPLTSFVVMNMASFLDEANPVVTNGLNFIQQSIREDGSWAIDTNLATWVTTHSIDALHHNDQLNDEFSPEEKLYLVKWLLDQQYQEIHPYTNSAPGGWAWTNLPGGVPDADDTSGALLALHKLDRDDPTVLQAAERGVIWLANLQNSDGGMPTFCKGWGTLPFDQSCCDITAHALSAVTTWQKHLTIATQKKIDRFCKKAMRFLKKQQEPNGGWAPLWFGNESEPENKNLTYGTAVVVYSLLHSSISKHSDVASLINKGMKWLLKSQNHDGGWGGGVHSKSSIEETALAVKALHHFMIRQVQDSEKQDIQNSIKRGIQCLIESVEDLEAIQATPIGFYFAELWYYEKLYPYIFACGALNGIHQ